MSGFPLGAGQRIAHADAARETVRGLPQQGDSGIELVIFQAQEAAFAGSQGGHLLDAGEFLEQLPCALGQPPGLILAARTSPPAQQVGIEDEDLDVVLPQPAPFLGSARYAARIRHRRRRARL